MLVDMYDEPSSPTGNENPGDPGHIDNESSRPQLVFALARGVATVVAVAAFCLISVMVIIGKAIVITAAETVGLAAILTIALGFSVGSMKRWNVDWRVVLASMDL